MYPYRYNGQIENYLSQFMRVMSGFQVENGEDKDGNMTTREVKVAYGSVSRIVGSILNKRDSFTNQTLPLIGFYLSGIEKDNANKRSQHHIDHVTFENSEGNKQGYRRIIGPAFNLNIEVNIYASSNEEMFAVLEQMLLIFNPRVTIQTDNNIFNADYITDIILESINPDINYPTGTESQVIQQSLQFRLPIRLSYPMDTDGPIIEEITSRILDNTGEFTISQRIFNGESEGVPGSGDSGNDGGGE